MLKDGWVVEDFREAPMEPLAVFRKEKDARKFAKQLGEHAYVHRGEAAYKSFDERQASR